MNSAKLYLMPEANEFGELVTRKRLALNLSQRELAAKIKMSATYINYVERGFNPSAKDGKFQASRTAVKKIAKVLGIDENEALDAAGYRSENQNPVPEQIAAIPYDRFKEQDIEEIVNFIRFKLLGTVEEKTTGDVLKFFYEDWSNDREGTWDEFFGKSNNKSVKPKDVEVKRKIV